MKKFALILFCIVPFCFFSQDAIITGLILDEENFPIKDVSVQFDNKGSISDANGYYKIEVYLQGNPNPAVSVKRTYMSAGPFNESNSVVTIPNLAGTGLNGNLVLQIREPLKVLIMTYDDWNNPIEDERNWPIFNVSSPSWPVQNNWTWTHESTYMKNGHYVAEL